MKLSRETEDRLHRGKRKILDSFGADPNVTGAGIGFRRRGGQWTEEPAVVVLVAKKRPAALVSNRRLLPATVEVDGVTCEVDVIQAGPFTMGTVTATAAADKVTGRMRPPRPGCSISNPMDGDTAGTLGLFVLDNKDGKVCLLSNNHVIARMGRATPAEDIIQPGAYDGGTRPDDIIAYVKRWAPIDDGTSVDAAIAELTDQKGFVLEPALDRMPGPSADHPVVGIHTAGDGYGTNALVRMDKALAALDVSVAVRDASGKVVAAPDAVVAPEPYMKIEKVGRTSGYSSSTITAIGVESYLDSIRFTDLILTESFGSPGDSGSAVFAGGDGSTFVEPENQRPCPLLSTVGDYYRLPLTQDNDLADDLRDDFLAQSLVGRLLTRLAYLNQQAVVDRLAGKQATGSELSYASQYYTKYHDFMATVLADPGSTAVVTEEHLEDVAMIIYGLNQTVLTAEEGRLAFKLFQEALTPTLGMNRRQVLAYMNQPDLYKLVYDAIAAVPTIETNGPLEIPG
ncbi:S1 family peptidase [Nonomuraea harbinensis]|uniref:S1 family peptidase n=1 Tax=Nonomuraea harbinensis TaxID=1286938 RepID=A0ABW1BSK7_9ACTN|nr:S1 family peptidase [Nonomuraea harbinensis]